MAATAQARATACIGSNVIVASAHDARRNGAGVTGLSRAIVAPRTFPMQALATPQEVVAFWRDAGRERWFTKDEAFDALCRERFLATHEAAARGDLNDWELVPDGALAVVLLLDQFPRNMFR